MSFRDIGVILNKAVRPTYKLFSDRKTPLEVAIELNVGESEVTKFYRVLEAKTTTQFEYGFNCF